MNISVVLATCRPESAQRWLDAWTEDFRSAHEILIVCDNSHAPYSLNYDPSLPVRIYSWQNIETNLGTEACIIPRRTSAIKSYGFLEATGDVIWTLDDDCFPEYFWRGGYLNRLNEIFHISSVDSDSWWNTMDADHMFPRGYPYEIRQSRPVGIFHGLWSGIPDLDGVTALAYPDFRTREAETLEVVPQGKLFPMCGMNLAFRRELLPAMYFMLQGKNRREEPYPFDRFDDIWAGLFAKRIADHFGYAVVSGAPSIVHTKESDPQERVRKEAPGIVAHEKLWKVVADWNISAAETPAEAYRMLADAVESARFVLPEYRMYWRELSRAMRRWADFTEVPV